MVGEFVFASAFEYANNDTKFHNFQLIFFGKTLSEQGSRKVMFLFM